MPPDSPKENGCTVQTHRAAFCFEKENKNYFHFFFL
jgi:hypothetical protein